MVSSSSIVLILASALGFAASTVYAQSFTDYEPIQHIHVPLPSDVIFATTGFRCEEGMRNDPYCIIGENQLSVDVVPQDVGFVGLKIRNAGYNLSVVDEIRVLDESGMLKTSKLYQKKTRGQVHFRRNDELLQAAGKDGVDKADLVLSRRPEVSQWGQLLRMNGINNEGDEALTLIFRTSHVTYDADLVYDALKECVLRVSVVLTGFDDHPNELRQLSNCNL